MKYIFTILFSVFAFIGVNAFVPSLVAPVAHAAGTTVYEGLVQCDGVVAPGTDQKRCDFAALVEQIKYLINWLFGISIPFMIGLLAWGGLLYMTGEKGKIDQAKKMFLTTIQGFAIMLVAWALIYTLLDWIAEPTTGLLHLIGG